MDNKVKDRLIQSLSLGFICMALIACSTPTSSNLEPRLEPELTIESTSASENDEIGEIECRDASGESVKLSYSYTELTNPHSISLFMNDQTYTVYELPASGTLYSTRDSINDKNEHLFVTAHKYGFMVESFFEDKGVADYYSTSKLIYDCINGPP